MRAIYALLVSVMVYGVSFGQVRPLPPPNSTDVKYVEVTLSDGSRIGIMEFSIADPPPIAVQYYRVMPIVAERMVRPVQAESFRTPTPNYPPATKRAANPQLVRQQPIYWPSHNCPECNRTQYRIKQFNGDGTHTHQCSGPT